MSYFGNLLTTLGQIIYAGASGKASALAGSTSVWRKKLVQTGNGTVSAAPSWINDEIYIVMTGDQSTTSGTAQNITELVTPTLESNSRYIVMGHIHIGCDNTGGVLLAVDVPASSSLFINYQGRTSSGTAYRMIANNVDATLISSAFATFNNALSAVIVNGEIVTGASTGVAQFQFAAGVAGQTATIYEEGTFIYLQKID